MAYVLDVNFGPIWDSVEVVKNYRALVDECNALDAENAKKYADYGKYGEETIKKELAKTEARRKEAAEFVQGRLEENKKKFLDEIDKQVLLDGGQISLGDMELLRSELIANKHELEALRTRHTNSPAMRRAIAKYAKNKGWEGFDDTTNERFLRAFAERFFEMCGYAPKEPNGYMAQFVSTQRTMLNMLSEFGIEAEIPAE